MFDLSKEKPELRDRYGRHKFGQDCLVARRLVEKGVPYVVINYPGGWDTHSNHFATMRRQCPQLDQGLATLLRRFEGPRPAREHPRLVLRRVRPDPQGRLAAALERRPQPLRQCLHRAGRRRRIQGRPRGRRVGRQGRRSQGPPRLPGGPAGQHLSLWLASMPGPSCPIPWGWRPTCFPPRRKA